MALWFIKQNTIISAPADTNDGKDPFGFSVSGGNWTASTKTLASTGSFAGYTRVVGDIIHIASATTGTEGWYKIASKDSDDQLTLGDLVEGAGITTDQTDVTSSDGPFTSIAHAWLKTNNTSLALGDEVRVCNDAVYSITSTITIDEGIDGTSTSSIFYVGANSRGTKDGTKSTLRADAALSELVLLNDSGRSFEDLIFDGNNNAGVSWLGGNASGLGRCYRCVFKGATSFHLRNRGTSQFISCEFTDGNGSASAGRLGSGRGVFLACSVHDCSGGFVSFIQDEANIINCLFYNIAGNAISDIGGIGKTISGCVFFSCTGNAISFSSGSGGAHHISNNAFVSNGGYGIYMDGVVNRGFIDYNHFHNNTSGETDLAETPGENNQSGDPLFANTTAGSEDFTPQTGSPLLGTGLDAGSS